MSRRRFTGGIQRRQRPPGAATGLFKAIAQNAEKRMLLRQAKRLPNARGGGAGPRRDPWAPEKKKPAVNRPSRALDADTRRRVENRRTTLEQKHQEDFRAFRRDPDHNHRVKPNSEEEARTALDMREHGQLPADVRRPDKAGQGDFVATVGGKDVYYDIKQWDDKYPAGRGGYEPEEFRVNIEKQIDRGRVLILDTRTIGQGTIDDMLRVITKNGWSDRVIWYP